MSDTLQNEYIQTMKFMIKMNQMHTEHIRFNTFQRAKAKTPTGRSAANSTHRRIRFVLFASTKKTNFIRSAYVI